MKLPLTRPKITPVNSGLIVERLLQQRPGFFALGLFAGQDGFAVLVFHPLKVDFNRVASLQLDVPPGPPNSFRLRGLPTSGRRR